MKKIILALFLTITSVLTADITIGLQKYFLHHMFPDGRDSLPTREIKNDIIYFMQQQSKKTLKEISDLLSEIDALDQQLTGPQAYSNKKLRKQYQQKATEYEKVCNLIFQANLPPQGHAYLFKDPLFKNKTPHQIFLDILRYIQKAIQRFNNIAACLKSGMPLEQAIKLDQAGINIIAYNNAGFSRLDKITALHNNGISAEVAAQYKKLGFMVAEMIYYHQRKITPDVLNLGRKAGFSIQQTMAMYTDK